MFKTTPAQIALNVDRLLANLTDEGQGILDNLDRFISRQARDGMSQQAIQQALLAEFDNPDSQIFGSLTRMFSFEMGQFMDNLAKNESDIQLLDTGDADTREEMWVAQLVNSCVDCVNLHGQVKTHAEWEAEGVPNIRPTRCTWTNLCYCELIPTDTMDAADKAAFKDPIKLQREKVTEYKNLRRTDGVSLSADYKKTLLGQANNPESVVNK